MSDIPGGTDPITQMVEQMKRDAFSAGWQAAMEAVSLAISGIERPEGVGEPGSFSFTPKPPNSQQNPNSASQPTVGTTPWFVMQAVQKKQGMTGAEVIAAVRADGHDVAEPQIRTALSRLEKRQLLANRHRKWFLK